MYCERIAPSDETLAALQVFPVHAAPIGAARPAVRIDDRAPGNAPVDPASRDQSQ